MIAAGDHSTFRQSCRKHRAVIRGQAREQERDSGIVSGDQPGSGQPRRDGLEPVLKIRQSDQFKKLVRTRMRY
jgi:hypothetical protein